MVNTVLMLVVQLKGETVMKVTTVRLGLECLDRLKKYQKKITVKPDRSAKLALKSQLIALQGLIKTKTAKAAAIPVLLDITVQLGLAILIITLVALDTTVLKALNMKYSMLALWVLTTLGRELLKLRTVLIVPLEVTVEVQL